MNKSELAEALKKQQIGVLSTLGVDNKVHGSTMFFINDSDLNFYLLTKANTRKFENVKANNKVALTIIFTDEQKTVQVEGAIDEVREGTDMYRMVIFDLSEKNAVQGGISWPPPLAKIPESELVIYQLVPDWLRYEDYTNQDNEVVHQIIPSRSNH